MPGSKRIGGKFRAAGDLVVAVMFDRRRTDDLVVRIGIEAGLFQNVMHVQAPSHFGGGGHDGADDLVIAGAAAQIAGQPVADFGFVGSGLRSSKRLRRDQNAGRADAALQSVHFQKLALQRMQLAILRHAFDRFDLAAVGFGRQHKAGADQPAVNHHAAGAAIAGRAAFLGAGQHQFVTQHVEQASAAVRPEHFVFIAIHGEFDVIFLAHAFASPVHMPFVRRASPVRRPPRCGILACRACRQSACTRPKQPPPACPAQPRQL